MSTPRTISPLSFLLILVLCESASPGVEIDIGEGQELEIVQQYQVWALYTFSDQRDPNGEKVDDRGDLYLRRGRIGAKGRIRETLSYKLIFAFDNLGRDQYTAHPGGYQDEDNDEFEVWDAYFTWHAEEEWANVTVGYFRPQVCRDNITTAFAVTSFTKTLSTAYSRLHTVGRSSGRETGVNLGGLKLLDGWSINYNVGLFDTTHSDVVGSEEGGANWAPLAAARLAFTLGDPEMTNYAPKYRYNYYGRRHGATLAVNVTDQGRTDIFKRNNMIGFDLLANYGDINFDAEYNLLKRDTGNERYTDVVYHIRASYNLTLPSGRILEPSFMYSDFDGDKDSARWPGEEHMVASLGVNWHLDQGIKLGLHYFWQDDEKDRGDFIGTGLQIVW